MCSMVMPCMLCEIPRTLDILSMIDSTSHILRRVMSEILRIRFSMEEE